MRTLSDTLSRLKGFAPGIDSLDPAADPGRLTPLDRFGSNPGQLRAWMHVPADLPPGRPLVLVLHGCTQTAAGYDRGSGWSQLADRHGFALLYAEQQRANNPNLCFNWFAPADIRRGGGEAESIRQMVETAVAHHAIDPARVFVTGLSAGGAMTSVMLAAYPELFAGGAIIAGLPYGVAGTVPEAFDRMRGQGYDRTALAGLVRAASPHRGPWPTVSVWHGTADRTVEAVSAAMILHQWTELHGIAAPDRLDRIDGHAHRAWHHPDGSLAVEEYAIAGMGHGVPLATGTAEACGVPGPYMLDMGISSTWRIAAGWGLVPAEAAAPQAAPDPAPRPAGPTPTATPEEAPELAPIEGGRLDPLRVINHALRAAGLLKP
jgi:poly(hydroxyalkanoate) depolymerase family esterase